MLKSDRWIRQQGWLGMIEPFQPNLIREVPFINWKTGSPVQDSLKILSYGCSSYGYDLSLSPNDFKIFQHVPGTVMDPKAFNEDNLKNVKLHADENGSFFILPAHSYGLGVALEKLKVPRNITVICLGKSTYARLGIIVNTTPAESEWEGHLTLEFSNSSGADCRLYANEGICQMLFFEGEECDTSYMDRNGKYQGQPEQVVTARV